MCGGGEAGVCSRCRQHVKGGGAVGAGRLRHVGEGRAGGQDRAGMVAKLLIPLACLLDADEACLSSPPPLPAPYTTVAACVKATLKESGFRGPYQVNGGGVWG